MNRDIFMKIKPKCAQLLDLTVDLVFMTVTAKKYCNATLYNNWPKLNSLTLLQYYITVLP